MVLRESNQISFIYSPDFLHNFCMSLYINRWHINYVFFNFQGFPLFWAASSKIAVSILSIKFLLFSSVSFVLRSFLCNFKGFPLLREISAKLLKKNYNFITSMGSFFNYNNFIVLKEPNIIFLVYCPDSLQNLSIILHISRYLIIYFLCKF